VDLKIEGVAVVDLALELDGVDRRAVGGVLGNLHRTRRLHQRAEGEHRRAE
jgi:hypothetical protein